MTVWFLSKHCRCLHQTRNTKRPKVLKSKESGKGYAQKVHVEMLSHEYTVPYSPEPLGKA